MNKRTGLWLLTRVALIAVVAVVAAGCSHAHNAAPLPTPTLSTPSSHDLAAVQAAVKSSGIFTAFRPVRLGRRSCMIPAGGLVPRLIHGVCETLLDRRDGRLLVTLSETWHASDFRGSGGPTSKFHPADGHRHLSTSWLL